MHTGPIIIAVLRATTPLAIFGMWESSPKSRLMGTYKGNCRHEIDVHQLRPFFEVATGDLVDAKHCSMVYNQPVNATEFFDSKIHSFLSQTKIAQITGDHLDTARVSAFQFLERFRAPGQ